MGTIGSLAARILADAAGVRSGVAATKEQLKVARQAFIDSRTDVEKYGAALDKLNAAKDAGVFAGDPAGYARALASLRAELDPVTIRKNKLRDAVGALTKQLKDEAATVGLSADQLELYRLKQAGATAKTLDAIKALQANRTALQDQNASFERASKLVDSVDRPLRQHVKNMEDLKAALKHGKITEDQYTEAARSLRGELAGQIPVIGGLLKSYGQMSFKMAAFQLSGRAVAAGFGLAVGGAVVLNKAVWDALESMRELDAQAGKVGMSANGFLALSRGADLANVSSDTLVNAMLELQKRSVEKNSLLKDLTPNEQFLTMLDQIRAVPGTAAKAEAAMRAFGDQGKELLPILRMSAAEYDRWKQTVAKTEFHGMDQAQRLRDANRAVLELKFAWEDMARVLATRAAPFIQMVSESLQEWLSKKETIDQIGQAMDALAYTVHGVGSVVLSVASTFGEMDDGTQTLVSATVLFGGALGGLATAGGAVVGVAGQMTTWYTALTATATGAKVAQLGLNTAVGVGYVAAAGAALVAGYSIGTMLVNQTQWAKDAAKAYDEYAAGVQSLQSREAKEREQTLTTIQAAPQAQRGSMLQSEMAMAQKQLDGLTARTAMAKEEMDRLQPSWLSMGQAGKKLWEAQTAEYEALKARAAEAGNWVNTLEAEMRKAGQAAAGMTPAMPAMPAAAGVPGLAGATPATNPQQEAVALITSLQEQVRWAGATSDELVRMKLAAQGLGPEWLRVVGVMQQNLGVAQRTAEARSEVERMNQALRDQIATQRMAAAGWSPEQIERWKLAQRGATAEQLQQLAVLQQQAAGMKAQQDAQAAAKQQQDALRGSLADTTKRLQEQIATAGMSAEETELWRLGQQGATREQLAQVAALQRQAAGLRTTSSEQRSATAASSSWTAATKGSGEALAKVEEYRRMLAAGRAAGPGVAVPTRPVAVAVGPSPASRPAQQASGSQPSPESPNVLLAQAVQLLQRIAVASEQDPIRMEATA